MMGQKADRSNTVFIMATDKEYDYNGLISQGYTVCCAYKKICLFTRLLREVCFRIPLLPKSIWYENDILKHMPEYIIIRESIITRKYLLWLQRKFPDAQINFMYCNMIGKARHIFPKDVPNGISVWTYDRYDSQKYNIKLTQVSAYFPSYVRNNKQIKYDVLFVGRDKGRGEMLLRLEDYLKSQGLVTKFVIVANGKFSKKKSYYQEEVVYEQIVQWVAQSRSVLNVALENQHGITVRDLECLFNKKKLITTNKHITKAKFYNPNNIFVLREDNWGELPVFIRNYYDDSGSVNWDDYSVEAMLREITEI